MRKGAQGGQGVGRVGGGDADQTLQLAQTVNGIAVICRGDDGSAHGAQVVVGDTGDAQGFELSFAERAGAASGHRRSGHDGRNCIGQGLHLGDLAHVGRGQCVDHITQQVDFDGAVHAVHANGSVVGQGGVGGDRDGGVVEDGVEAIHNGLHFGGGIGLRAGHIGIVQGVVDGSQVVGIDTGDTRSQVLRHAGGVGGGAVVLSGVLNRTGGIDRVVDDRLHAGQGVQLGGIDGRGQSGLHGAEVGRGHASDAQSGELCLGGVAVHHGLHGVGQCLHLRHGAHIG